MRTSALLAFIFAAVSAPSLAAPIWSNNRCNRVPAFCELGLGSIGPIPFTMPVNTNVLSGNKSNQQRRYDEDEGSGAIIFPPSTHANLNGTIRGHLLFPPPVYGPGLYVGDRPLELKRSRDLHELILRAADADDESGAFWKTVWNVFNQAMGSIPQRSSSQSYAPPPLPPPPPTDAQRSTDQQAPTDGQQQTQQRREYLEHVAREYNDVYELLARAAADDESGASLFSIIRTVAGPLINMFTGGSNNQRRAMIELLTRAAQDDESGADLLGVLGDVGNAFLKIFSRDNNQRREMVELLARAAEDDESGAGILDFITSLFTRDNNQRREMVELLARAAEDDESGAGLFSFIRPLAGTLINVLTGGGSSQQQQRRDLAAVVEPLTRANYDLE